MCLRVLTKATKVGRESVIFQTYVTFSIDFPNIYNDYLPTDVIDLFLLFFLVKEGDFPARRLRVSHLFCSCSVSILFLTKYDKIMS